MALAGLFSAAALSTTALVAQGRAEVVQGRVTSDSGAVVTAVEVVVTRSPDRALRAALTDTAGRYSIAFPDGTGDYLVHVNAPGWRPFRVRVVRTGADSVLTADVRLAAQPVELEGITVRGQRERPRRGSEPGPETGASEAFAEGVAGALAPEQEGDLAAMAATVPGFAAVPGGLSVLGLGPDQIGTTLNGMAFAGANVPRDARTRTRVSTSTYDPARGGFSGAQVALELSPGSIYSFRRAHATLDGPPLQFTDPTSERLGGRFTSVQASAGGDGELVPNRYYYNMAVQASRRASDAVSLASAGADVLRLAGVAADSAERFLGLLAARGIPAGPGAAPSSHTSESLTYIGRLDRTPGADRTWNATAYGKLARSDATGLSPTATPSHAGRASSAIGSVQGAYSFYFGSHYLNETKSAFSYTRNESEPSLRIPGGFVQVSSLFEDETGGLATLAFGGNGSGSASRSWTWETTNETQWYNRNSRHRIKLFAQSRLDGYSQSHSGDRLGTFGYRSLVDLAADRPSSFSRTLGALSASGEQWSGALALGDLWRASPRLQLLYGVRLEANRFLSAPAFNPAVRETFGARTDHAPNAVHLSPRLGFTWIYGSADGNTARSAMSALGTRFQGPTGVLRGGIGEFRNLLPPTLLSEAALATGLPGGARRLVCLGPAVPTPDWAAYANDPAAVPDECEGSGSAPAFADAAPGVHLFDESFAAPRSWRGNLAWNSRWKKLGFNVEGVYSLNLHQPGTVDLNFAGAPFFALAGEGNRPVFVSPSGIVPATGAVSPVEARVSSAFGPVTSHVSDLRSESRQLTLGVTPDLPIRQYFLTFSYTLSHARAQHRGFDGAAFGDPGRREWAPGDYDSRHRFLLQAGWGNRKVSVTMFGRLASGLPFTPLVDGDVNGDGITGDRAFVFDPAVSDASLAAGTAALLGTAPSWARRCVESQAGRPAGRNSCRGPWTQSLNARVALSSFLLRTRRANLAVTLGNPLGGLDQLLHGSRDLRGWGTSAMPDPVLYRVHGFDAAAQRFRYEVNPRFGDTRPARTLVRAPFRLTLDVSIDWGTPIDVQQLNRSLRPGRDGSREVRRTAESLMESYSESVPDVYSMILEESDSLMLSPEQTGALKAAQVQYRRNVDAIWTELARYLTALPDRYDAVEALKRQEDATDRAWEASRQEGATIKAILSPLQQRMLPSLVDTVINSREKIRIRYIVR